ncbi:antitoxin VapB family protein [Haladaptatus sp. CMAA 1911]|uniref:antitoxin VapB family protein n=1 Tax=unclassified Haladaptatus TaxID=2622732 RepID=UPI003754CB9C
MGTKTIRLDDEAYDRLKDRKGEGESFSDVVKRLTGERSLLEFDGILSDEQADAARDAVAKLREHEREQMAARRTELSGETE